MIGCSLTFYCFSFLMFAPYLCLPCRDMDRVNFSTVAEIKDPLIAKAAKRLISDGGLKNQLEQFRKDPIIAGWLEDAAYFAAIDDSLNTSSWYEWPEPLKNRHLVALEEIYQSKKEFIDIFIAQQFLFQRQWQKVREYAQMKGISIMGDMPIYVGYHSADVWANKKHFLLSRSSFPLLVSGVPPDAFSKTGQLWNSPLYDWKAMEKDGYSWWIRRIRRAQNLFDEFRIDHFRGFAGFWAVPSEAKVAMVGRWKVGPGKSLFDAISKAVGDLNIIAEDLGVITEDVIQLRKAIGAPGMAVLQFGFGSDAENPHLPHNHEQNQVVYTGTHDNETIRGWWDVLPHNEKSNVLKYVGNIKEDEISWALIQAALSSVAQTTIIPMQDVLGLGSSARMNIPATQFGNWSWRIPKSMTFDSLNAEATKLRNMLAIYGRL
ncbi:4-alpha-glucanotransferase, chloroplastic amyloplastic [Olea europaea subsp. europaea]|uniref:4-alpha-glucanotransferase n=1 Tax=Olea europaea subsp. europaea TaxID=158383 RepID=A0A8S0RGU4_OLEEU|nr:4-alpha-glucanotransferase, chloroplastic amyloplastic [Olea europaea subsp. europaea]